MTSKDRQLDTPQSDQWDVCPSGVLTQMVSRLDATQRSASRKQVFRTALLSTAVFTCVVLSIGSIFGSRGAQFGGINCAFCQGHLAEYYPHAVGEVVLQDAAFVKSMETHLEECSFCHKKFIQMYPDLPENSTAAAMATNGIVFGVAMRPIFAMGQQSLLY